MPDHLRALRLAAGEGPRRALQRQVAEADLDEGVEGLPQRRQQRPDRRLVEASHPFRQVADLHGTGVGDVDALDLRRAGGLVEARAAAVRAGRERHDTLDERPDVGLHRLHVLGEERLLDVRDDALVGEVDALDLDLGRLPVEQVVQLLLRVLADGLVRIEVAAAAEDTAEPAVHAVAGHLQGALVERLARVVELVQVEVAHRAHALAARAHAAQDGVGLALRLRLARPALYRDGAAAANGRDVEGEGLGRPDVGLAEAAEEDAQHGVGVRDRADGRADVGPHAFLVDDDRRREAVEDVHVGARQRRHEALHEGAVRLVDHPLRLGGDGAEHERALA